MTDVEADRDSWCTPRELALAIGPVDLDPCSNPRSHIVAARTFSLEEGQDGLQLARFVSRRMRTHVNPPYSRGSVIQWVHAYRHTRFDFLVRHDTRTEWWRELWPYVGAMASVPECEFEPPPGVEQPPGSPFPHILLYASASDVTDAVRALCYVSIPSR